VTNRQAQRTARAVLTGGALLLLTLGGHTAGGGSVDGLGLAIVAALSAGLAASTTARAISLPRLLTVLVAGQVLLHLVLAFSSGHAHHGSASPPLVSMLAGHAVAALLAALVVRHADGLVARWIAFVSTMLGARPRPGVTAQRAPSSAPSRVGRGLSGPAALLHQVVRRGPPAGMHLLPA
jgi:hypothetical protein